MNRPMRPLACLLALIAGSLHASELRLASIARQLQN
jgi:hypothetical protein